MSEKRLVDVRLVRDRDGVWRGKSGDAEPQVFAVSSCRNCPMCDDESFCAAAAHRRFDHGEGWPHEAPPSWCPLKTGPAVVMLAEDT
jgi:hypothetical protein